MALTARHKSTEELTKMASSGYIIKLRLLTTEAQRNAHDFMSPMGMKMDESHIYEYS